MRNTRLDPPRSLLPALRARLGLLRGLTVGALVLGALALVVTDRQAPARQSACPSPPVTDRVGFPLRLADPAVLAVVRAGARVDILVRSGEGSAARLVAADLTVLRTVGDAGVLYLGVSRSQATVLAAIRPTDDVSVTVRSP